VGVSRKGAIMTSELSADDIGVSAAELQVLLLSTAGIEEFLQKVADLAASRVTDGLSCGITLRPNGRPLTVANSDELAATVDEVQYGIDKGPCLHAMRTGEVVSVPDTAGEPRWAGFEVRAAAHGVGSSLSIPLIAEDRQIGALNLYAPVAEAFGPAELRRAEGFAATASGALALAMRQAEQADLTEQLRAALASRAVIDQALGVIMAQERCTAAQAFEILRRASQNRNVKLREVAENTVTSISGAPPQGPVFRDR
jgi:GAF domain-containing protein